MGKAKTGPELIGILHDTSLTKAGSSWARLVVLGILAGAYIAFAAQASTMAAFNLLADPSMYGLGKALSGAVFAVGLMLCVVAGAELFTGNTMMAGAVATRTISIGSMLRNWGIVYAANFIGSILIVCLISTSGLWHSAGDLLGGVVISIAAGKTSLGFESAFVLGILCNWLVCLAIWMAWAAEGVGGKLAAVFFPIWLFVTSGFEHSIANMYFIPAGIVAKAVPAYAAKAAGIGVSADALAGLDWHGFFINNLVPVTLGNIIGGGFFVALAYVFVNGKWAKKNV